MSEIRSKRLINLPRSLSRGGFIQQNDTAQCTYCKSKSKSYKDSYILSKFISGLRWVYQAKLWDFSSITTTLIQDKLMPCDSFTRCIILWSHETKADVFFHTLLNNVAEFVKSYLIQSDPLLETMCLVSMGCNGSFLKTLSLIMGEWLLSLFSQAACSDKKWEALWVSQMSKENYAGSIMSIRR